MSSQQSPNTAASAKNTAEVLDSLRSIDRAEIKRLTVADGRSNMLPPDMHQGSDDPVLTPTVIYPEWDLQIFQKALDIEGIKAWLDFCREHHGPACTPSTGIDIRGFRIIDCETWDIVTPPQSCEYVALRYVWGSATHELRSTAGNKLVEEFTPRTIKDVILVAQRLGMRYLWIDRYCIDQENKDEKHNLILYRMRFSSMRRLR